MADRVSAAHESDLAAITKLQMVQESLLLGGMRTGDGTRHWLPHSPLRKDQAYFDVDSGQVEG